MKWFSIYLTSNCFKKKIVNHYYDTEKDFWNTVVCFAYKDWSLTESDMNFLEKQLICEAKRIGRYIVKNSTLWNSWLIQKHRIPDIEEFIEDLKILLTHLWYPVFKEFFSEDDKIYYLKKRGSDTKMICTEDWFLVLKWSILANDNVKSFTKKDIADRQKFLDLYTENIDWKIVLKENYLFWNLSLASFMIAWTYSNW